MTSLKLLDTETMFDALVTAAATPAGLTSIQALHADSFDEVPYVSWQVANNGQIDHAFWSVTLILEIVSETTDLFDHCSAMYAAVTGWNTPGDGVVADVGAVNTVTDRAVFDKTFQADVHGKYLAQSSASFTVSVEQL